jgi:hypothetical protein
MTTQNRDTVSTKKETLSPSADNGLSTSVNEPESIIQNNDTEAIDPEENDANISTEELKLLNSAGSEKEQDDINEEESQLDDSDEDGDLLNEGTDYSGDDLDIPGAELDDADELIGEEDEENSSYSESDQDDK